MNGKILKLNDYKLTFGQETVYVNIYAAFKNNKTGNKYVVYSYDNNKLYYGSLFIRNSEIVVMASKTDGFNAIKDFLNEIIDNKLSKNFEIISLDNINSIQVIEEIIFSDDVDMKKLYDLSIPKPEVKKETDNSKQKKGVSFSVIFFVLFLLVLAAFFFINPEVLHGKSKKYICKKSYVHDKLPANVNDDIELVFTHKGVIESIKITSDYVFTDVNYYSEFKEKGYFYKYMENGDTYKFDDNKYTYRLFSNIDTTSDYFMPTSTDELITYYAKDGYKCMEVEN